MRILHLTTIFPPQIGGPATQCSHLCRALQDQGITPVVVTYGDRFSRSEPEGYPVYTFRRRYGVGPFDRIIRWIIFPFFIRRIFRRERIDLLHCHSVNMLSFAAARIARRRGIPRVLKFAGDWVWETLSARRLHAEDFRAIYIASWYSRLLTVIERRGLRLFNLIWTPSEFRRANIEYLIGTDVPTRIIPNCLLLPDVPPAPPRDKNRVTVISANRFIPHKRIPWLIEAYAAARGPHTRLVLVGGGDPVQVRAVRDTVKRLNLEQEVTITGILSPEAVYEQFAQASIYVSASLEEGFPNVFIEAMHFGLPIVATDAGGSRELVREGKTGFLVPPHDQHLFEKQLRQLIQSSSLREQLSTNARAHAARFDLRNRIGEFIRMYEELISPRYNPEAPVAGLESWGKF